MGDTEDEYDVQFKHTQPPVSSQSSKKLLLPPPENTTLSKSDWEMIDDELLPFEITAILIFLGGAALLVLSTHVFVANELLIDIPATILNAIGTGWFLPAVLATPAIIGSVQMGLAVLFGMAAALEQWQRVSIQDVIRHHLPERMEHQAKKCPANFTARCAYLLLMTLILMIQITVASVALGVNDYVAMVTNQGGAGIAGVGFVREILDVSTAVFDECCANDGWSKQDFIPKCAPGTSTLGNCTVPVGYQAFQANLCVCYLTSVPEHMSHRRYANETGLCKVLTQASIVIVQGQKIPGSSISIRTLIPTNIPSIPLVGDDMITYGCGVGYVRGFQWSIVKYTTDGLRPYFVAMLAITLLQFGFLILGISVVCKVKYQRPSRIGEDGNIEYGDDMNEVFRLQGLRRLLFSPKTTAAATATTIMSPQMVRPRFRARTNSSGNGLPDSNAQKLNAGLVPFSHQMSPFAGLNDTQPIIGSPLMMAKAAARTEPVMPVHNKSSLGELGSPEQMRMAATRTSKLASVEDIDKDAIPQTSKIDTIL